MLDKTIINMKLKSSAKGSYTLEGIFADDGTSIEVKVYRGGNSSDSRYDPEGFPQRVLLHGGCPSAYDAICEWLQLGATTHHFVYDGVPLLEYTRSPVLGECEPISNGAIDFSRSSGIQALASTGDATESAADEYLDAVAVGARR